MPAWEVIIVKNDTNNKHVKGDEQVSHDALQNSYNEHVDNSTPLIEALRSEERR